MVVQPQTRRLQRNCFVAFQSIMGAYREDGDRLIFTKVYSDRTSGNGNSGN